MADESTTQLLVAAKEGDPEKLGRLLEQYRGYLVMPGNTTSPSGHVMREEAALAILEALHQLPETQAEAVRLRYMEGLPLAEICQRLDKSETAVAGLLKRGLRKLRSILVDPHAA